MTEYSALSKILHHLTLGQNIVPELTFDIEKSLHGSDAKNVKNSQHIFIAGLARAGTTILMRSLYDTGEFSSLTYRDMPFILAPNLWAKLTAKSQRSMEAVQRAHGDGIDVDFDSPEALEEIFWRVFTGKQYIKESSLDAYTSDYDSIEYFRDYIALINKKYNKQRYLSKNNNNILRIASIQKAFPNATIIIPFRDPIQHANSLLRQHQLFSVRHSTDTFSQSYMTWLVHHEFGGDHRPFNWGKEMTITDNTGNLNYWLGQWLSVYTQLFSDYQNIGENIIFMSYELLCENTELIWPALFNRLNIPETSNPDLTLKTASISSEIDPSLHSQATSLYASLSNLCKKGFN